MSKHILLTGGRLLAPRKDALGPPTDILIED